MKNILSTERGLAVNLVLATVLVAVAMSAMTSMLHLINDDTAGTVWLQDRIQQELLLRSESGRLMRMLERDMEVFPERVVEMVGKGRIATYRMWHIPKVEKFPNDWGDYTEKPTITTRCETKYGRRNSTLRHSPVVSRAIKVSQRQSLTQFQYFSDSDISDLTNDPSHPAATVRFFNADIMYGRVHSNTDIYIGPSWPTFYGPVTTATKIRVWTGTGSTDLGPSHPISSIFLGGLRVGEEGAYQYVNGVVGRSPGLDLYIEYLADAVTIKNRGIKPWGLTDTGHLYLAVINSGQSSLNVDVGEINETVKQFAVHYSYPDPHNHFNPNVSPWYTFGDTVKVGGVPLINNVRIPDTTWVSQETINVSTSCYFPGKLWIRGNLGGEMTLASLKDSYIIGNITYAGTPIGQTPDGYQPNTTPPQYPGPINRTDFFGLVSEGKIIIKYKYRDREGVLHTETSTSGNVYLYGAYSAQGASNPDWGENHWRAEGTFTYEYQHPHGTPLNYNGPVWRRTGSGTPNDPFSLPPFELLAQDTTLTHIALHRFRYPPMPGPWDGTFNRWPGASTTMNNGANDADNAPPPYYWQVYDWPPYKCDGIPDYIFEGSHLNPVYPEARSQLAMLRGNLWVFGSIAQRRRGFVRRSGNQSIDNPDTQPYWDLPNYVFGGPHSATGYDKRYFYDRRFTEYPNKPPHFPEVYFGRDGRLSQYDEDAWFFTPTPLREDT